MSMQTTGTYFYYGRYGRIGMRQYYSATLAEFLKTDAEKIHGILIQNSEAQPTPEQKGAWMEQLEIMKNELCNLGSGRIYLEFIIPRMGRRADAILFHANMVFLLEFKIGKSEYEKADKDQCMDYALDMKNFHEGSHTRPILPILVATGAGNVTFGLEQYDDGIFRIVCSNGSNLSRIISTTVKKCANLPPLDAHEWERSGYRPTPTIIEAARALYNDHDVCDITRSEAGAENLSKTTDAVEEIIGHSRAGRRKSICFVTGIPGAGKTLVGLNLTAKSRGAHDDAGSVFLSGNGPLVEVLQEALARDKYDASRKNSANKGIRKEAARREASAFIQPVRGFIADALSLGRAPHEKIVIFDEAQRAWDVTAMDRFMAKKKEDRHGMSQPEYIISAMDRHADWAVLVCLVGGGQEINHNEAGLAEWFDSIRRSYPGWDVYVSPGINGEEYLGGHYDDSRRQIESMLGDSTRLRYRDGLHLDTSIRSFRSGRVSEFVRLLLDCDGKRAGSILADIKGYPIVITRNFELAKKWLQKKARGTERFGIVAAAKSYRLRPHGIYVEITLNAPLWFLNSPDDPRSSNGLEYAATEFKVQGLELDWTCVAWDADLRYSEDGWIHREFRGDKWTRINKDDKQRYLKNAYRVLLTRARQGMVIFVPEGDLSDSTRCPEYYNATYRYLREIGIPKLHSWT